MADIFLFIQQGWKNIWRQKNIFLFSMFTLSFQIFNFFQSKFEWKSTQPLFYIILGLTSLILSLIGFIGMPYLVYCSATNKQPSIQETLSSINKFGIRVIGCSCLSILALSPIIVWALVLSIKKSTVPPQISDQIFFLSLPVSIFSAVFYLAFPSIFANDHGILQSAKDAWNTFIGHFTVLAILGILITVIFRMSSVMAGALTVFFQSGFNQIALAKIDLINPSATLGKNALFVVLNSANQIILNPLGTSAFIFAYLKYSEIKAPSVTKRKQSSI